MLAKSEQKHNVSASEKPDMVMVNFRKILKEKQEKKQKRKKKAISYGTKVAVAMVLFVGVIAFKNQSGQISVMEQQFGITMENSQLQEAVSDAVVVEDLSGDVKQQEEVIQEKELPVTTEEHVQEQKSEEPEETTEEVSASVQKTYTVQTGDTLAKISRDFYGTDERVAEICALNEISDGDYIQAGEIILLP